MSNYHTPMPLGVQLKGVIFNMISLQDDTHCLDFQRREQLSDDLAIFVQKAIVKYIRGQQEHGGNITDRNLVEEIENEVIDLMFYNAAQRRKPICPSK